MHAGCRASLELPAILARQKDVLAYGHHAVLLNRYETYSRS